MHNMQDLIIEYYHDNIGSSSEAAEALPPIIATTAELIANIMINDGKVLVYGEGYHNANAAHFCNAMIRHHNYDAPSLPVINLGADSHTMSTLMHQGTSQDIYARQISALGNEGDLLLLLYGKEKSNATLQALQNAHANNMLVVVIGGGQEDDVNNVTSPNDINIIIPHKHFSSLLIQQLQLVLIICELVHSQLFEGQSA